MFVNRCRTLSCLILLAALPAAAEDLTVVAKQTRADAPPTTETSYFTTSKMKVARGEDNDFIVDYATGTMTRIDNKKREYSVVTRQDMEAMAAQMKSRMDAMPPEMREKMAGMMGGMAQTFNVQKGTGGRTVAGHACENWVMTMGEMMRQEYCVTKDIPFPVAVFDGMKAFTENMAAAMGPMGKSMAASGVWDKFKEMKGFPVATTTTMSIMGKNTVTTSEVTEIRREAIPDSVFAVPADYKKVDSPMAKSLQKQHSK
jgi:hypothetical protein